MSIQGIIIEAPGFDPEAARKYGYVGLADIYKDKVTVGRRYFNSVVEVDESKSEDEQIVKIRAGTSAAWLKACDKVWMWELVVVSTPMFTYSHTREFYDQINKLPFLHAFVPPMECIICSEVTD